jgi:phospholipid/cholesterol/gamma-HCH transport system permease protein
VIFRNQFLIENQTNTPRLGIVYKLANNSVLRPIVHPFVAMLTFIGESTMILGDAGKRLITDRFEFAETVNQMTFIGAASIPIVLFTNFFSGAVLSLYTTRFLMQYGAGDFIGATVGLSVTREVGPVIAGIMVAARCGSAMAAQIGSMAVTEQIDALKMLSVHPTNYLVIPRVVAAIVMLPVLALIGIYSAGVGGGLIAQMNGLSLTRFIAGVQQYVRPWDVVGGLCKGPFFGLIIAIVACQQGMRTKNGAVGVGQATTNTVVISMVLIYVVNFFLAQIFFGH